MKRTQTFVFTIQLYAEQRNRLGDIDLVFYLFKYVRHPSSKFSEKYLVRIPLFLARSISVFIPSLIVGPNTSESLEQLLVDVILPLEWRKNYHLHF